MAKVIGIDLGTTNSCVSVMENGKPIVVENSEGARTTPSVVAFTTKGERLVGLSAKRQAVTNPKNTLFAIKRLIGRRYDDAIIKKDKDLVPYIIAQSTNGDACAEVNGKKYSPSEISAYILEKIKKDVEAKFGETITEAVITVPAYFNDSQRQATKDAGRIAGLNVLRIINEPTAAALAYGMDKKHSGLIAVYDLGGGTFDVSILDINEGLFEVKATNGDTFLGGEDFDKRIIDYLLEEFKRDNSMDLGKDPLALQRLKEAAEKAKIELSSTMQADINLPFITADAAGPKHLMINLTRAKLESLVEDLIQKTIKPCEDALKDAGVIAGDIKEIILVGGQTRMPKVIEAVSKFFGKRPNQGVNPDEVVAMGAAVQAGVIKGDVKDMVLLDVTPLSLSLETLGGVSTVMIERNKTIPTKKSQVFTTAQDNQPSVTIRVAQGERPMFADNKLLGEFDLVGITPAPKGVPQIEVTFDIDANGLVNVSAKDAATGKQQSIRIKASGGLSEAEIKRMVEEGEKNKEQDQKRKELVDLKNRADQLIHTTKKTLNEHAAIVTDDDKQKANDAIAAVENVLSNNAEDHNELQSKVEELDRVAMSMGEAIYKSKASSSPGDNSQGDDLNSNQNSDSQHSSNGHESHSSSQSENEIREETKEENIKEAHFSDKK